MSVLDHSGKSAHQLRTELRKAHIDLKIMERKLTAANAKIEQLTQLISTQPS